MRLRIKVLFPRKKNGAGKETICGYGASDPSVDLRAEVAGWWWLGARFRPQRDSLGILNT